LVNRDRRVGKGALAPYPPYCLRWWGRLRFAHPIGFSLAPPRRLECLRRIDIEEGTKALDRDFRHRLAMPVDQMAGADVAVERHQLVEEVARASSAFGEQRT
jgi:hypothetical protein